MLLDGMTIETSTVCNGSCIICPNSYKPRASYNMPLSEFQEIITCLIRPLRSIVLCGMYEPLADPRLNIILQIIEHEQPKADITIFSNASLLTNTKAKMILRHHNVKNIVFSVHGLSPKVYESIMLRLKRDQVYRNILHFLNLRKMQDVKPKASISFVRVKQNIHELAEFREYWKDKVDVVSDFEVMNWNGSTPKFEDLLYETPIHIRPCPMFDQPLVIDAYGRIVKCCYDFFWTYGLALHGGLERWQNKKRESDTYPLANCKPCVGWKHY